MKFEVGQVWKDGMDQVWRVTEIKNGDVYGYPVIATNIYNDFHAQFTLDGHFGEYDKSCEQDLKEYLPPEKYPEYYI